MAYLRNGASSSTSPGVFGGASLLAVRTENWTRNRLAFHGGAAAISGGASITETAAIPNGYEPPYSVVPAIKGGGLAAWNTIEGEGTLAGALALGLAHESALSGSGDLAGALSLIVQLEAAVSGSGDAAGALQAILGMAAALSGSGDAAAALGLIVSMSAALDGSGGATGDLKGLASLAASIVSYGDLTPEGLRDAVWNALATAYNGTGTMGAKLNAAGSAGDPWASTIEGALTAGELMRVISAALAGEITVSAGAITVKAADDTGTTRIAAVTDGTNRTNITLTP